MVDFLSPIRYAGWSKMMLHFAAMTEFDNRYSSGISFENGSNLNLIFFDVVFVHLL